MSRFFPCWIVFAVYWSLLAVEGFAQSTLSIDDLGPTPLSGQLFEIYAEAIPNEIRNGASVRLKLWGRVAENYHIYSIQSQGQFGPEPTQLIMNTGWLAAESDLTESETVWVQDTAFNERLRVHKNDFWLEQHFRLSKQKNQGDHELTGDLVYQICSLRICSLPLTKPFTILLKIVDN
jgi:hypothetical protein